jgi:hypothetical protein
MQDYFCVGPRPCIVTELLGPNLDSFMRSNRFEGFHPVDFRSLVTQILQGINCKAVEESLLRNRAS